MANGFDALRAKSPAVRAQPAQRAQEMLAEVPPQDVETLSDERFCQFDVGPISPRPLAGGTVRRSSPSVAEVTMLRTES